MTSKSTTCREHISVQIQTLAAEGVSADEIARKLKVGRTTVFKWKNKKTVFEKKRSGRPKILSFADKKQIKSLMYRKFGSSVRKTAKILTLSKRNIAKNKKISKNTIHRHLKTTT